MLFLSRLAHAKGVDDLIAGFAASSASADLTLVIAGDGPAGGVPARGRRRIPRGRPDPFPGRRRRRREAASDGRLCRVRAAQQAAAGVHRDVRHRAGGEDAGRRRPGDHDRHRRDRRGRRRHGADRARGQPQLDHRGPRPRRHHAAAGTERHGRPGPGPRATVRPDERVRSAAGAGGQGGHPRLGGLDWPPRRDWPCGEHAGTGTGLPCAPGSKTSAGRCCSGCMRCRSRSCHWSPSC